MKRIVNLLALVALAVSFAAVAGATPNPNSAVILARIFNDCPTSVLTTVNAYPALIAISDELGDCGGYANLHAWRFSSDGLTNVLFPNNSNFRFEADMVLVGPTEGEAGIQLAPWWSQADGRLNCRTSDGEIACFGGRLPFYSFTANHGLHYVKGTSINLSMTYLANGLSMGSPATIEYVVVYNGNTYSSGPLAFDEGNPNEDPPYGLWGCLNDAKAGGYVQPFLQGGNPNTEFQAIFKNIVFEGLDPIAVDPSSWSKIKADYR